MAYELDFAFLLFSLSGSAGDRFRLLPGIVWAWAAADSPANGTLPTAGLEVLLALHKPPPKFWKGTTLTVATQVLTTHV